jgi:protein involved in polysaccharide export with SLBB domain
MHMMRCRISKAVAVACAALTTIGCSTSPTDRQAELTSDALSLEAWARSPKAAAAPPVYRLQVGDVVDVRFPQVAELNETVTLRPDGRISLTWVGEQQAAGMTPPELATALRAAYRSVLRTPLVDVLVRSVQPQRVYVAGEVVRPGEQQLIGPLSALQAIVRAGDFSLDARRDSVVVIRQNGSPQPDYILLDFSNDNQHRQVVAALEPCSDRNLLACEGVKPMQAEGFQLQPMDMVIVSKTRIAGVAQFFERYVNQILPVYRNIGVSMTYPLGRQRVDFPATTVTSTPSPSGSPAAAVPASK